jgi:ribosomal protein S26
MPEPTNPDPIIDDTVQCTDCGESVPEDDAHQHGGQWYCESCDDSYTTCERCSDRVSRDDAYGVYVGRRSTETWCEDCNSEHTFTCESCDSTFSDECDSYGTANGRVCGRCYENNYCTCGECGEAIPSDDSRYHEGRGEYLCESCYEDEPEEEDGEQPTPDGGFIAPLRVCDYSYRPQPVFFGSRKSVMYGVELEVNTDKDGAVPKTLELLDRRHVYLKYDGSLNSGFEIVTHPHTLAEHRKLWPGFFADVPDGVTSFKSGECGMHVHIERAKLTRLQIGKIMVFLNAPQNRRFVEAIAQRSENRYCKIYEKKLTNPVYVNDHDERYEALNVTNRHTVEVRIFRGTVRADRFWKNMEFVDAMVQWTRDVSYRELTAARFVEYVRAHHSEYKYLFNYLVEIGYTLPLVNPLDQVRKEILAECA